MIYQNVMLTARRTEDVGRVAELLGQHAATSLAEPGCERFEVYHSQADEKVFLLIERWADDEAFATHRDAMADSVYTREVIPLVDRVPHPSDLLT